MIDHRHPAHLLIRGDARRIPLASGSVHCVVTSPPYFGLRDYQTGKWDGGDPECGHRPAEGPRSMRPDSGLTGGKVTVDMGRVIRDRCHCGAVRVDDQIGLEATPDAYVARLVEVFREVRRVMRDDATLWLNLGDSYASTTKGSGGSGKSRLGPDGDLQNIGFQKFDPRKFDCGIASKQLLGIPWRVAFALQADGWYLRSDIIWAKPNPMPESVTDRPTKSHEYVFLLVKRERYYYDADAIRELSVQPERAGKLERSFSTSDAVSTLRQDVGRSVLRTLGRNKRSVWTIATQPYDEAHFATFPPKLIEPCIKAGTSEKGCCPACGKPWARVVERNSVPTRLGLTCKYGDGLDREHRTKAGLVTKPEVTIVTKGWEPSCSCGAGDPVPCVVLDPFAGSGTTAMVAAQIGRRSVGLDLSADYLGMARRRIADGLRPVSRLDPPKPRPPSSGQMSLFDRCDELPPAGIVENPSLTPDRPVVPLPGQASLFDREAEPCT